VNVAGANVPAQVPLIRMDKGLLPTLDVQPVLGRNFDAQEDHPHGPPVVMLGYGFWMRSYGGDRSVIGRSLRVEGVPHTIVGVLPAAFNTVLGPGDVVLPAAVPVGSRDYSHNGTLALPRCRRKPMRASERCTATWAWAATGRSRASAPCTWRPSCDMTRGRCCCCSWPARCWCC
jgi:putative ABC transport system permease protein